jgi:hypothetical protein
MIEHVIDVKELTIDWNAVVAEALNGVI